MSETGVPLPSVLWLALRSGGSAARAGAAQVALLMWLRTLLNFQYAKGGTLGQALSAVRAEAGGSVAALVARLYRGAGWALLQAPASRFGDAAANELALRLFGGRAGPAAALSALLGGMWRVTLMPIDSLKTLSQVHGAKVGGVLSARLAAEGVGALYAGAVATLAASALGHYPWFFVFNLMDNVLPHAARGSTLATACRNALRGLCASCASDVCSNAARVLKAARQAAPERAPTYLSFARGLLARKGGAAELFGKEAPSGLANFAHSPYHACACHDA